MTFLLIIPAWLVVLFLIAGLCYAARLGDAGGKAELQALEAERLAEGYVPAPRESRPAAQPAHAQAHAHETAREGALIAA